MEKRIYEFLEGENITYIGNDYFQSRNFSGKSKKLLMHKKTGSSLLQRRIVGKLTLCSSTDDLTEIIHIESKN